MAMRFLMHFFQWLCLCTAAIASDCLHASDSTPVRGWRDSSFELQTPGKVATTGKREGWEVQRTGREQIRDELQAEFLDDRSRAYAGKKSILLGIPAETEGFEFVTLAQRITLQSNQIYEASVWVRWPDGPSDAPAAATATSGHPSAIVSFWARHRDGEGSFAGRDEWLFDSRWHRLCFRFCATDPSEPTLVYVSLLPNQKPVRTQILIDEFALTSIPSADTVEQRAENLIQDPNFSDQNSDAIHPPWYFANIGGNTISCLLEKETAGNRFVTIAMNQGRSNFESAQLWQHMALKQNVAYEVSCRLRWNHRMESQSSTIVNLGIYHDATQTWYGPIDQILEAQDDWHTYRFTHIPPMDGNWKMYIQLNGWGNFGRAVSISIDDCQCQRK
jgi:hypothetical protein